MAIVAVTEADAEVSVRGGALVVIRQGHVVGTIPPHEVEELHVYPGVDVTRAGRNFLLAQGIDTVFFDGHERVRGRLVAHDGRLSERRLAQYRVTSEVSRRLPLAVSIVTAKIRNQRELLMARQRTIRSETVASVLAVLRSADVSTARDLDAVRGAEGRAANLYFGVFGELLRNPVYAWDGRNRRPPRDPINAMLSFGYAVLVGRCESALLAVGLDPFLGVLHETGRGRVSLALDLAEVFRPVVDSVVLTLVNRQQLGPEDFDSPADAPEGAVYLGKVGREVLLRAWARKLQERSPHPIREGEWTLAGLVKESALSFARAFEEGEPLVLPVI